LTTNNQEPTRIAEVVETTSTGFTAQCYELYGAPALGSLVRVGEPAVYAIVHNVTTAALDLGRRVMARGAAEASEAAVYHNNPQIARLLATHIEALVVGHGVADALKYRLPAAPPRIHAFVYCSDADEIAAFTQGLGYLRLLTSSSTPAIDEVIAANLRLSAECHRDPDAFRTRAGKALASELAGDVARLNAILRSIA
jgi:hypothetical protein